MEGKLNSYTEASHDQSIIELILGVLRCESREFSLACLRERTLTGHDFSGLSECVTLKPTFGFGNVVNSYIFLISKSGFGMNRIFILIGIINQLATTRINRILKLLDLPMAQFALLQHFSHRVGQECTVTQLARAMEVNQPSMTKTTQRLMKKGFLQMRVGSTDKRLKVFSITEAGSSVLNSAWEKLAPEVGQIFSKWDPEDLNQLQGLLERLKIQLDDARN